MYSNYVYSLKIQEPTYFVGKGWHKETPDQSMFLNIYSSKSQFSTDPETGQRNNTHTGFVWLAKKTSGVILVDFGVRGFMSELTLWSILGMSDVRWN